MPSLFRFIARLPLPLVHAIGALLGWFVHAASPAYRRRFAANLAQAGITDPRVRRAAIANAGRGMLEIPAIWFRPLQQVLGWIREIDGLEHFEAAERAGRGILLLTPHLGCFELLSFWLASRGPVTVLYRPPRVALLREVMAAGRARDGVVRLAPTNLGGVRKLIRTLRAREIVGLLPDQVPSFGDGAWVPFFGRDAYTMTLPERLVGATGATIVIAFMERLPGSTGYRLRVRPFEPPSDGTSLTATINRAIESAIRACPSQYLWAYNRYKGPARPAADATEVER